MSKSAIEVLAKYEKMRKQFSLKVEKMAESEKNISALHSVGKLNKQAPSYC